MCVGVCVSVCVCVCVSGCALPFPARPDVGGSREPGMQMEPPPHPVEEDLGPGDT